MEHRWGRRVALRIPVRLATGAGEPLLGQMLNVSISGAFVQTARPMPLWSRLQVEVVTRHHHRGGDPERVPAHITRRVAGGVGIEWCDLAPRSVRVLLEATQAISKAVSDLERGAL